MQEECEFETPKTDVNVFKGKICNSQDLIKYELMSDQHQGCLQLIWAQVAGLIPDHLQIGAINVQM